MKSYPQLAAIDAVALVQAAAIDDAPAEMLAFAPDGKTWASADPATVRFFEGDLQRLRLPQQRIIAGAIGFSRNGATLRIGTREFDVATGARSQQPPIPDLAAWAAAAGQPAPPTLGLVAACKSDDGTLVALAATGVTRDRREGLRNPESGDVDWLIALDGATRQPTAVLWHGNGVHKRIAISDGHVVAGGDGLRVFARDDLTTPRDLGAALHSVIAVAWSPDGALLAAVGATKKVVVWRTGQWDAPAASWEVGSDYQSALAFHPTRPLLLVGNRDGHVRGYGVDDAALSSPPLLLDHDVGGQVDAVAFSPDGASLLVAVGPMKNQILRFDLTTKP